MSLLRFALRTPRYTSAQSYPSNDEYLTMYLSRSSVRIHVYENHFPISLPEGFQIAWTVKRHFAVKPRKTPKQVQLQVPPSANTSVKGINWDNCGLKSSQKSGTPAIVWYFSIPFSNLWSGAPLFFQAKGSWSQITLSSCSLKFITIHFPQQKIDKNRINRQKQNDLKALSICSISVWYLPYFECFPSGLDGFQLKLTNTAFLYC